MSDGTPDERPGGEEATLPLTDRLFWLTLVILVFGGGTWRVLQLEFGDADAARVAISLPRRGLSIDLTPTGSIAPRATQIGAPASMKQRPKPPAPATAPRR